MTIIEKIRYIGAELRSHAPFTLFGAVLGLVFMYFFRNIAADSKHTLFAIFHPAHVLLSAMVTTSMFELHKKRKNLIIVFIIGYVGSIGVATVSDIVMPHIGTHLLGLDIPTHSQLHHHEDKTQAPGAMEHPQAQEEHGHKMHFGFIEEWYLVNPAAVVGILIAFFIPRTKFPHAGHILISTWASSAYVLMDLAAGVTVGGAIGIFVILFLSVWLPCCFSDIIFPLLFVGSDLEITCACGSDKLHGHSRFTDKIRIRK